MAERQHHDPKKVVVIRYTNHRGETSQRRVVPLDFRFALTEWHPGAQWILDALDLDKDAVRSFAMKDIYQWNQAE